VVTSPYKDRHMTEDVKPEYETPPPTPDERAAFPVHGEEEESVYTGDYNVASESEEERYAVINGAGHDLEPLTETASDEDSSKKVSGEPIWTRLRRLVLGGANRLDDPDFMERIHQLNEAIEHAPDTPANYVLRGEVYLSAGAYELAKADFQRGYELAAQQFERSDWGFMAQAMRDRAQAGLEKVNKKLQLVNDQFPAINAADQTNLEES